MKIALVCSHGGHYTEMKQLLPAFKNQSIFFVTYKSARAEEVKQTAPSYFINNIGMNPIKMLSAFISMTRILIKEKPDVIITTGAEIGLPAMLIGRLTGAYTIYIESWCRVKSKSLTGRLVYPFVNEFLVQWPSMLSIYGKKAKYYGGVA